MSVFGWCAGPEGTTGDHDACRLEIGTDSGVSRCDCPCHEASK